MPLEGQWARQQAPFLPTSRRELRVLIVAAMLTVVLVLVVAWAAIAGSTRSAGPGCRYKTIASTTGGAVYKVCDRTQRTGR
jgi:hypothetical protein